MAAFDLFISHASEDKEEIARPLAEAMEKRGHRIWLDALELTIGDSLNARIDQGLARSSFGLVILSRAFFSKAWPQRELAALAARETGTGSKVILPVWHGIDVSFLLERAPMLADRVGVDSSVGVDTLCREVERALAVSGSGTASSEPLVKSAPTAVTRVPRNPAERASLLHDRPGAWEYLLFASVIEERRSALESKWRDHELHIPRGPRRVIPREGAGEAVGAESHWVTEQVLLLGRLLSPEVQERAFGKPGEAGDEDRIEHLAERIADVYEGLMDWSAALRHTSVPDEWEEVRDVTARKVDGPVAQLRAFFIELVGQFDEVPALVAAQTEDDGPIVIHTTVDIALDPEAMNDLEAALARLRHRMDTDDF